jgi:hypothetical protein
MEPERHPEPGGWQLVAASGRKNADAALVVALAGGKSVEAAAGEAGVSERTAYRRLADPAFRQRVTGARATMVERALGELAAGAAAAVGTLRDLHADKATPPAVRQSAARSYLEMGRRLTEAVEVEQRLAALEQALELSEHDRQGTSAARRAGYGRGPAR